MLWDYRQKKTVKHAGKTYDIVAISPTFPKNKLGTYPKPIYNDDYWGTGSGAITVDYQKTSDVFWPTVKQDFPIAIMSFSRWQQNKEWVLHRFGSNYPQNDWQTILEWKDASGEHDLNLAKPYIGAGMGDPATPNVGGTPQTGGPPDSTQAANLTREGSLPRDEIITAISTKMPSSQIVPIPDNSPAGSSGKFVSMFMTYHVAWYQRWWSTTSSDPKKACLRAGHTHVGSHITVAHAQQALEIQIEELFKVLP